MHFIGELAEVGLNKSHRFQYDNEPKHAAMAMRVWLRCKVHHRLCNHKISAYGTYWAGR
jgi:hypothetical protein